MSYLSEYLNLNQAALAQGLFWLQGPGGNTSYKENNILFIKPSGYRIERLKSFNDLSQVDLKKYLKEFSAVESTASGSAREQNYKRSIEATSLVASLRPSMETGFHAALEKTFVFHIHSLWAVLVADLFWDRRQELLNWYSKKWESVLGPLDFIPAIMPGADLAVAIKSKNKASVLFLQNHGAIFQFDQAGKLNDFISFEKDLREEFFPSEKNKFSGKDIFHLPELMTGPMKFYFPDMVILYPRLKPFLKSLPSGMFEVDSSIESKDPDALENWLATQMLFHIRPQLRELPAEIISQVPHLPTEVVRQKVMEKK